ncbi:MAG: IS4 family transposase [Candidatus Hydrothermarchaeota archaeon]
MNKFNSIFSQILHIFPRMEFEKIVRQTQAEKGAKGFSCWQQFVAMMFCQLGQAHSLREICHGLASCFGKVKHLGMKEAPKRSTLSYANEHRPWEVYQKVFFKLLSLCQGEFVGKKKFRFRNKLLSFDATLIELCASLFNWARYRRTKGAVKLHLLLDHEGYLPEFVHITEGKVHELRILRTLHFSPGTIVVFDRGCVDYELFSIWTEEGVYFVTRLKRNADYRVVQRNPVPERGNILRDDLIQLHGFYSKKSCPYLLRRIVVWDAEKKEEIILLTNHLEFGATTISAIYKDRWQIEIFFKMLKQNLRVKTFVGTSANALKIQIWTALIAILILKYLQMKARIHWSLSNLVALLRLNLFTYRSLWRWINNPYETPPIEPLPRQMSLDFKYVGQHRRVT